MNASKILQQLMSQASGSKSGSGGMDVKGVIDGLSRHLGGNSSQKHTSKQRFQRF